MKRMKKLISINVLRGIACLIVLFAHIISTSATYGMYVSGCGKIGVWCFLVISGFLTVYNVKKMIRKKSIDIYQNII